MKKKKTNGLKEFFNPTKWKILLTAVLSVTFPIVGYLGEAISSIVYNLYFLPFVLSNYFVLETRGGVETVYQPTLWSIIVGLLVYLIEIYLISCIIVKIYWLLKKNDKKN